MKKVILTGALVALMAAPFSASAAVNHADKISAWEGTKTCTACHPDAAKEVAESLHYQQLGEAPFVDGAKKGELAGMMKSY